MGGHFCLLVSFCLVAILFTHAPLAATRQLKSKSDDFTKESLEYIPLDYHDIAPTPATPVTPAPPCIGCRSSTDQEKPATAQHSQVSEDMSPSHEKEKNKATQKHVSF
ncbi:hypothetical protein TRIUR3_01941 [Triticum urartu]|uniref:Epidermal patterning factor-like protein n=2 Tax=Triticum TaxID=4564 RepID=A0A9R0U1A9_TRITD|nr:uncharacterized protein LOC123108161 [Triticum aestivum]XP_048527044.1 uncharacterized protein LOC125506227 [Triticum urartu]EMS67258.1 hypothetical protein TRIUR3_01941 [Triticum urartu]VAI23928.1 unnamed protein product [Triticum turgidum subsp. durum]